MKFSDYSRSVVKEHQLQLLRHAYSVHLVLLFTCVDVLASLSVKDERILVSHHALLISQHGCYYLVHSRQDGAVA
jgi:hypothetical protein